MTAIARAINWFVAPPHDRAPLPTEIERDALVPATGGATLPLPGGAALPLPGGAALRSPGGAALPLPGGAALPLPGGAALPLPGGATRPGAAALVSADPLAAAQCAAAAEVTSAAVLGRAQDVVPVAAGLALALRRETRAKVATVVVIGDAPGGLVPGGGAGPAARRIAARLEAHGLEPVIRGRIVWVRLDPQDARLLAFVRRVLFIAAPVVLAITAPRTPAIDEALAEQDLVALATSEPDGPLARIAATDLPSAAVVPTPPLTRGPARAFARAGLRAPAGVRKLVRSRPGAPL